VVSPVCRLMRRNWCRRAIWGAGHWRNRAGGAISGWLDRGDYGGERQNDYHFAGGRDSYRRKVSYACGRNIGTPAISFVDQAGAATWTVLEVSSFQLETIVTFRPRIAVILNITPDHLDRHKTFANYVNAKARVFENQGRTISPCSTPTTPRPLDWRGEREGS